MAYPVRSKVEEAAKGKRGTAGADYQGALGGWPLKPFLLPERLIWVEFIARVQLEIV